MQTVQSSRWYAVMALIWIALTVSQTVLATRRGSVVDWLIGAGFAVLATIFAARWTKLRRSSSSTS
jgi:hypothetical protein